MGTLLKIFPSTSTTQDFQQNEKINSILLLTGEIILTDTEICMGIECLAMTHIKNALGSDLSTSVLI